MQQNTNKTNKELKAILDKAPYSDNYHCPNCGAMSEITQTMVYMTESIFNHEPDPHYSWEELHKCSQCESYYKYNNGT